MPIRVWIEGFSYEDATGTRGTRCCGEKRGIEKGLMAAAKYAPEPGTGTW